MCDDCRDMWGDEIYHAVKAFEVEWPDAEFGPAHIVLSDFNCEVHHIDWCAGLILGELRRRGVTTREPQNREREGVREIESGYAANGFYADVETEELIATEVFLREWLRPRAGTREATFT